MNSTTPPPEIKSRLVLSVVRVAFENAFAIPADHRADFYEGIALITQDVDAQLSATAQTLAQSVRDFDASQFTFRGLLNQAATKDSEGGAA